MGKAHLNSVSSAPTTATSKASTAQEEEMPESAGEPILLVAARISMTQASEKLKALTESQLMELHSVRSVLSALSLPKKVADDPADHGRGNSCLETVGVVPRVRKAATHMFLSSFNKISLVWGLLCKSWRKYIPEKLSKSNMFGVFFMVLALVFYLELHTIRGFSRIWLTWQNPGDLRSTECTVESPKEAMTWFRPPVSCSFCQGVSSADRVRSISPHDFEERYAYSGRPVVITDSMEHWTAPKSFSFPFFKSIYVQGSRSLEHDGEDCLFFPYKTEFRNLAQVFNMTEKRYKEPWYIGWSNCDAETSHILRQHYQRPYFLPTTAESTHADWIFMGTPGYGAHMHIDHVINPSWQAQITGTKRWSLLPPPECYWSCKSFEIDVHPGDIIVLDTNKWYHQTLILPGDMSITIGSEYD